MTLAVNVHNRRGAFELEAAFGSSGRLTALFGPSGSGKTSLVNLIAGLEKPQSGRIEVNGRVLVDTERRIFVPPHKRRIGYVFQDARLFPHLTVDQNLRYGRFFAPAADRYAQKEAVVDLLGIGHLLARKPANLSGGERQRVAIGRALIASPRLLLMDEPLASLDETRKAEILPYIERLRDELEIPIVYVSHAPMEVARLATDLVVLRDGRVQAAGPAREVMSSLDVMRAGDPADAGTIVRLEIAAHEPDYALTVLRSPHGEWRLPAIDAPVGARVLARVRARDVMVATAAPHDLSALNVLNGTVSELSAGSGPDVLVSIDCGGELLVARVTRKSVEHLSLEPGRPVYAIVKSVGIEEVEAKVVKG